MRGLSVVAASGGYSSSWCAGLSLSRPLLLRSTSSRRAGSVVVAHGPSCSGACGIFPDQGSNPCPLHWQADSQPLRHQGSPHIFFIHSSVDGHLGCFHVLAIVNNATMNIAVHVSFQIRVFIFSGYLPKSGIAGSYGNSKFGGGVVFWFLAAHGILVPQPRIALVPPAVEVWSLF